MGAKHFRDVAEISELDDWFERSQSEDVVLFLHDYWCPVSSHAHGELSKLESEIALIDVAQHRNLTASVQERTGVKHESPQVIILRAAKARWAASHYRITSDAVSEAIAAE